MRKFLVLSLFVLTFGCQPEIEPNSTVTPTPQLSSDITTSGFTANWSAIPNASYELILSEGNVVIGEYKNIKETTLKLTGLTGGFQHHYEVRAKVSGAYSAYSSKGGYVTTIPDAPVLEGTVNITTNSFVASWVPVSCSTEYELYISKEELTDFESLNLIDYQKVVVRDDSSYKVTGLDSGADYYIVVVTKLGKLKSSFSNMKRVAITKN